MVGGLPHELVELLVEVVVEEGLQHVSHQARGEGHLKLRVVGVQLFDVQLEVGVFRLSLHFAISS